MTAKQKRFAKEYLVDLCAAKAACRAGYSPKVARQEGCKLLRKLEVSQAIAAAAAKIDAKLEISTERIREELARIAFTPLPVLVQGGRLVIPDTDHLTPAQRAVIAEVSETVNGIKIRAHDKLKALELLGKTEGMYVDRVEHEGEYQGPLIQIMPPVGSPTPPAT